MLQFHDFHLFSLGAAQERFDCWWQLVCFAFFSFSYHAGLRGARHWRRCWETDQLFRSRAVGLVWATGESLAVTAQLSLAAPYQWFVCSGEGRMSLAESSTATPQLLMGSGLQEWAFITHELKSSAATSSKWGGGQNLTSLCGLLVLQ